MVKWWKLEGNIKSSVTCIYIYRQLTPFLARIHVCQKRIAQLGAHIAFNSRLNIYVCHLNDVKQLIVHNVVLTRLAQKKKKEEMKWTHFFTFLHVCENRLHFLLQFIFISVLVGRSAQVEKKLISLPFFFFFIIPYSFLRLLFPSHR